MSNHYFGLRDDVGQPKPAYCAFQVVTGNEETCADATQVLINDFYLPLINQPGIALPRLAQKAEVDTVPLSVQVQHSESEIEVLLVWQSVVIVSGLSILTAVIMVRKRWL